MQMLLPSEFSTVALDKGWGIIHPLTGSISGENSDYVMIFGPRDEDELQAIWIIAQISYYHARGRTMDPKMSTAITPATLGRVKDSLRSVPLLGDWMRPFPCRPSRAHRTTEGPNQGAFNIVIPSTHGYTWDYKMVLPRGVEPRSPG